MVRLIVILALSISSCSFLQLLARRAGQRTEAFLKDFSNRLDDDTGANSVALGSKYASLGNLSMLFDRFRSFEQGHQADQGEPDLLPEQQQEEEESAMAFNRPKEASWDVLLAQAEAVQRLLSKGVQLEQVLPQVRELNSRNPSKNLSPALRTVCWFDYVKIMFRAHGEAEVQSLSPSESCLKVLTLYDDVVGQLLTGGDVLASIGAYKQRFSELFPDNVKVKSNKSMYWWRGTIPRNTAASTALHGPHSKYGAIDFMISSLLCDALENVMTKAGVKMLPKEDEEKNRVMFWTLRAVATALVVDWYYGKNRVASKDQPSIVGLSSNLRGSYFLEAEVMLELLVAKVEVLVVDYYGKEHCESEKKAFPHKTAPCPASCKDQLALIKDKVLEICKAIGVEAPTKEDLDGSRIVFEFDATWQVGPDLSLLSGHKIPEAHTATVFCARDVCDIPDPIMDVRADDYPIGRTVTGELALSGYPAGYLLSIQKCSSQQAYVANA
eukprot:TRINITY_DN3818_c0_g1_i2.p1 TRINITY_DN3818_c0_g1~~TRINITY_DN3818_c0_g1_i2.p1  ORF type:complete len:497 (+),score=58.07 TRINITY_DN3818_c0_g1_i2:47-1537(+)